MEPETLRLLADAYDCAADAMNETKNGLCLDHIETALRELRRAMVEAIGNE